VVVIVEKVLGRRAVRTALHCLHEAMSISRRRVNPVYVVETHLC